MDPIKQAFSKVKEDLEKTNIEISFLKKELIETRNALIGMCEIIKQLSSDHKEISKKQENKPSTNQQPNPTNTQQTHPLSTDTSTDSSLFRPLNSQISGISTGNQGVPTDRQTDQQTDRHIEKQGKSSHNQRIFSQIDDSQNSPTLTEKQEIPPNTIKNAANILDSLDNIKKEIRLKFKRLTDQEMTVFSALYQLDQQNNTTNYREIAEKLNLSESSIRDYIGRLIKKGVPVDKKKLNNKTIQLKIDQNLKKIASLNTILQLRDL